MMTLGDFIEITLWYKHINKAELAQALGASPSYVYNLIKESWRLPPKKIKKLSELLDVPLEVLFMWQGHELANNYKEEKQTKE